MKSRHFILVIITLFSYVAFGAEHIERDIRRTVYEYVNTHTVNATYKIEHGNDVVVRGASGYFSFDTKVKLKVAQVMPIASCTKPMTASAILLLMERDMLSVDDTVSKYLTKDSSWWPQHKMPTWADKVTIHQLLTHTSGIAEYMPGMKIDSSKTHDEINHEIIAFAAKTPLAFTPGSEYKYCNTGYVILGLIIEQASKQKLADFFKTEFFDPIGMHNTFLASLELAREYQEGKTPEYPTRYFVTPTGGQPIFTPVKTDIFMVPFSDGGVLSSADDLCKWNRALHGGKVLSKASYDLMIKPYMVVQDKSGYKTHTGYGMFISTIPNGETLYHHGGNAVAIRAECGYAPESKIYFAMLSNVMVYVPEDKVSQIDMDQRANQIDLQYFRNAILDHLPRVDRKEL